MKPLSRRTFLKSSVVGGAAAALAPYSRVLGANDDIRVAVVGFRSQGSNHIKWFGNIPGVRAYDYDDKKIRQFKVSGGGSHHENFIKAVRSRKVSDLNADILDGYLSTALCHMGNISYRLGRTTSPEKIAQSTGSKKDLLDTFERASEHLSLHDVDLGKTPMTLGPWLTMDSKTEKFVGEFGKEANLYLSRNYRAPFTIPAEV